MISSKQCISVVQWCGVVCGDRIGSVRDINIIDAHNY